MIELIEHPDVQEPASLVVLFSRIGERGQADGTVVWDTAAARAVGLIVKLEVLRFPVAPAGRKTSSVYTVHINMHSGMLISHADRRPMYVQLVEQIRHRIAVGDWLPGHELPSIRALAAEAQVSVITVKRAYFDLEREGVIATRQGRGSFVTDRADLGTQLHYDELAAHLLAAVDIGRALRLTAEDLERRLRDAIAQREATAEKDRTTS